MSKFPHIDPQAIPGALADMTLDVKEDFQRGRVLVHVSYQRHAIVSLDVEALYNGTVGQVADRLALAARQATEILRDDVRKALGATP